MRKTKIVCTLGPATDDREILKKLMKAGLNVARFNFSHGTHEEQKKRMDLAKEVSKELGLHIGFMLDTKGPEIRTGDFENGIVKLQQGDEYILTSREITGNQKEGHIQYDHLGKDLSIGNHILIDDGLISMEVEEIINDDDVRCRVLNSGEIKNKKGVNIPNVKLNLPSLTQKDKKDLLFGIKNDVDFVAASFIRKKEDVLEIREFLEDNGCKEIGIISKIENREGVDNIDDILRVSNGIMVARGDLGVEIDAEEVPLVQKDIINKCNKVGEPVITATQMLDSMIRNPRPTRAEVSDVATAIFEGSDAIMLSGETAAGKYPVEAVETMVNIACKIEDSLDYEEIFRAKSDISDNTITNAISVATCRTTLSLDASAVITATSSGYTAREVAKFRPKVPIIAATHSDKVMRKMSLVWGAYPIKIGKVNATDELIDLSVNEALEKGYIKNGDLVVVTAGVPVGIAGSTNLIKVHVVSQLLFKGVGAGKQTIYGKAVLGKTADEIDSKFNEGDIIVTTMTEKDMIPYMEKASAVITTEGGLTSHAFIAGMNLGLEVVVGFENAFKELEDGEFLTINGRRGVIYRGEARVL
ncbi:MAG: pyruvate kinase [Bacillota bacterium]|nr:pyruvate kinase [Bacillota bacterium]